MSYSYDLFLDDERIPASSAFCGTRTLIVCRDDRAFKETIRRLGLPQVFHLDHDLGENSDDGTHLMKWLLNYILDNEVKVNPGIQFFVHSQNPIGAQRMLDYAKDIRRIVFESDYEH